MTDEIDLNEINLDATVGGEELDDTIDSKKILADEEAEINKTLTDEWKPFMGTQPKVSLIQTAETNVIDILIRTNEKRVGNNARTILGLKEF